MTQEEKHLLIKDLCGRLPYDTWVQYEGKEWLITGYGHGRVSLLPSVFSSAVGPCPLIEEFKPYLRPLSSMTEEEKKEWHYLYLPLPHKNEATETERRIDWLNAHHFDYRGLIEKWLAFEAPEGMYKQ